MVYQEIGNYPVDSPYRPARIFRIGSILLFLLAVIPFVGLFIHLPCLSCIILLPWSRSVPPGAKT